MRAPSVQHLPAIQGSPLLTAPVRRSSPAPLSPVYKGTPVSLDNNSMSSSGASPCLEASLGASPVAKRFSTPLPHDFVDPSVFDDDGGPCSPIRSPSPAPSPAPESPCFEPKKKKKTTVAPARSQHSGTIVNRTRLPFTPAPEQRKKTDIRNKPAPSGRYVLYSPTKFVVPTPSRSSHSESKPAPSTRSSSPFPAPSHSSSNTTCYSLQNVRENMVAQDIEPMYLEDTGEILAFFEKMGEELKDRIQYRDRNDKGPLLFKGVLKDWVIDHAIGHIPPRKGILLLNPKVSLSIPFQVVSHPMNF